MKGRLAWSWACEDANDIRLAEEDRRDEGVALYSSVGSLRNGSFTLASRRGEDGSLSAMSSGCEAGKCKRGIYWDFPGCEAILPAVKMYRRV